MRKPTFKCYIKGVSFNPGHYNKIAIFFILFSSELNRVVDKGPTPKSIF